MNTFKRICWGHKADGKGYVYYRTYKWVRDPEEADLLNAAGLLYVMLTRTYGPPEVVKWPIKSSPPSRWYNARRYTRWCVEIEEDID